MIDLFETQEQRRAREVQGIFARTSGMVWDALPPEARKTRWYGNERSFPDYEEDWASHGGNDYYDETATSQRGEDYYRERSAVDGDLELARARVIGDRCREEGRSLAADMCDPERRLPNGAKDNRLSAAECMRFWAEGMPDETWTRSTAHEQTHGSSHEFAIEGELGGEIDPGSLKGKGALKDQGGESTTMNQLRESRMTRRGDEGYERECLELQKQTYKDAMRAKDPFAP